MINKIINQEIIKIKNTSALQQKCLKTFNTDNV